MSANFDRLETSSVSFREKLASIKSQDPGFKWYPYDTIANITHLKPIITPQHDFLFEGKKRIADIGAADGDLAFYLESLGNQVDIYDYPPTNMNGLKGANLVKRTLGSSVGIHEVDLDSQMSLKGDYDLIILLGILYHLKNPFYVLETLAKACKYAFVSTRVARYFYEGGPDMSDVPCAYLLDPVESNNDPTNYWIFSQAGLKRLFHRAGWNIAQFRTVGDLKTSNPQSNERDERAFALLESRYR